MRKTSLEVDVTDCGIDGCRRIAVDLLVPEVPRGPALWCCVPGGGAGRGYFDLDVPGGRGAFSMARFAAERGVVAMTIDPPGAGDSDRPDDGYDLTPSAVADVLELVIRDVTGRLAAGHVTGAPPLTFRSAVGVGHSAGALLLACQQARHRTYDALALLGFSDDGLPGVLTAEELGYSNRPVELREALPRLVRTRFGQPLPMLRGPSPDIGDSSVALKGAVAKVETRLLALVGMMALVPGSMRPELERIDVPTLAAMGDHDIAGRVGRMPAQLPACRDLTLFTLPDTGHNHNYFDSRLYLWSRLLGWTSALAPAPG